MLARFERYLGKNVPIIERLFYIATALSAGFGICFCTIGYLIGIDILTCLLFVFISVESIVFFLIVSKTHRTKFLSIVYLVVNNLVLFPVCMIFSTKNTVEMPIYGIIGLTFILVLMKGCLRYILFFLDLAINVCVSYYCYVIRMADKAFLGVSESFDFFRLEVAVVVSGMICGIIVYYRNKVLMGEMKLKEDANAKAELVNYAKDMFLVNVSHEIRTPLNAIIGTTDLLLESDANNHIKEMAFNISNSSHALLSITSDLLDFSRMNIDSVKPVSESYDIAVMLNDIINLISVRLLDTNVDFFVYINPSLPKSLIGDGGKIRQIMINMLSNGVKYTREGYIKLYVDYAYDTSNTVHLTIKVEDTGIGIKPETIEKIFEPYNRSGEITDRLIEGNGLGLALCRKLATTMGGSISCESEYGKGSTFTFEVNQYLEVPYTKGNVGTVKDDDVFIGYFANGNAEVENIGPILKSMQIGYDRADSEAEFLCYINNPKYDYYLLDVSAYEKLKNNLSNRCIDWKKLVVISDCNYSYSDEPFENVITKPVSSLNLADMFNHTKSYSARKQTYEGSFSIPNATVLIVDDNLVNLDVAAGILSRYEPDIITAASGRECLITLESQHVDIIYLDYMMPDMDGIDTLKAIREFEQKNDVVNPVPVIALTANVVSGAREMFLNEGFDDYLTKPIEIDKLEKSLIEHLDSALLNFSVEG